jgi:hypothetical protein
MCLIWLSTGAIEELLRRAGLCDAKKTLKALEARIVRLGLPRLPESIVHLRHLKWDEHDRLVVS